MENLCDDLLDHAPFEVIHGVRALRDQPRQPTAQIAQHDPNLSLHIELLSAKSTDPATQPTKVEQLDLKRQTFLDGGMRFPRKLAVANQHDAAEILQQRSADQLIHVRHRHEPDGLPVKLGLNSYGFDGGRTGLTRPTRGAEINSLIVHPAGVLNFVAFDPEKRLQYATQNQLRFPRIEALIRLKLGELKIERVAFLCT